MVSRGGCIFDEITKDDLVLAFFPCIYFCGWNGMNMTWNSCKVTYRYDLEQSTKWIIQRGRDRQRYWELCIEMAHIAESRGLRLVMENSWTQSYLHANFVKPPALVDTNRTMRGDCYAKPTAYWFFNCEPTHGSTIQRYRGEKMTIAKTPPNKDRGKCGEKRSMMRVEYAENFIDDFILGKPSANAPSQCDMSDALDG